MNIRTAKMPRWASVLIVAAILCVGVAPVLYYILGPARGYMTSDTTDSLLWAYEAYTSGRAISEDFYYAAILPFGGNQIFYPFLALFGFSMRAQLGGLCLFAVLFALALWFFATGLGLDRYRSAGVVSMTMLILSSSAKLREIVWEHIFYYNLGILFFCFGMGLVARLLDVGREDSRPRRVIAIVCAAVLGLFTVFASTDGLQALICLSLPLIAGLLAERLFADERLTNRAGRRSLWIILLVGGCTLVGLLLKKPLTGGITASYQEAYSTWSASSKWISNLNNFLPNWLSLFGVSVTDSDPLASGKSVVNMIRLIGGLLLLVIPLFLVFRWKRLESRAIRIALVGHLTISAGILFAVVFGSLGGANWRLTPMLGTSAILSAVTVSESLRGERVIRRVAAVFLTVLVLLSGTSLATFLQMKPTEGRDNCWFRAQEALEEHGLRYGFANFWWAEYLTMISDGRLQVANIRESQPKPTAYRYQCRKDAFDPKEDAGSYFLLLTEKENTAMAAWLAERRSAGLQTDAFTIEATYDLRGHVGETMYVYVYSVSPLEAIPK